MDHRFEPVEIHVQTGRPTVLFVTNGDAMAEEFDATAFQVEKVIAGGHYATIRLRLLGPRRYPFTGEFHPDTAKRVVVSEQRGASTTAMRLRRPITAGRRTP